VKQTVTILDTETGLPVDAELDPDVTVDDLLATQREWRPYAIKAATALARQGSTELIPQHLHWDWTSKASQLDLLANSFTGLRVNGSIQGIMKLQLVGDFCRARLPEQKGQSLAYLDYLESAPWNLKPLMDALGQSTKFSGIGSRLIRRAVEISQEEGFSGRLGLHSLPLTESFYRDVCRMTPVGRDPSKQNLLWFEFTKTQANDFLAGVRS
jgi:hypothetical protein